MTQKYLLPLVALLCFSVIGCRGETKPKGQESDKLNSSSAAERIEGIEEATNKYGGSSENN